jgi:hypothetical protein
LSRFKQNLTAKRYTVTFDCDRIAKGASHLKNNTIVLENLMSDVKKGDCISLERAQETLGVARGTLNSIMAVLSIPKYKFPLDRRSYILRSDFDRIRQFREENEDEQ